MSDGVDVSPKPPAKPVYLGDAVYASFDGYQIWLHLGSHESLGIVAIEPSTYQALHHYALSIWGAGATP